MSDRPILFSAAMVRANLDDRKTQTRRVLRDGDVYEDISSEAAEDFELRGWLDFRRHDALCAARVKYAVGDRLWVREAHILADRSKGFDITHWIPGKTVGYLADGEGEWVHRALAAGCRRRPSIHMPRWASRTTLLMTDVRIERLQDISEADAIAEGVEREEGYWRDYLMPATQICTTAKDSYATLWNCINGPGAWEANPWVVATTYTVHRCNIDAMPVSAAPISIAAE